jgi:hypothetical protein
MFQGQLLQSEATAARRRVYFHLVDATDGMTPETGEAAGQPQLSKNGGAWANTSATLSAIGNGRYYVELTAGELDTLGAAQLRYKSANTAEAVASVQVVAFDVFAAASAAPSAATIADAVWDEALSGHTTAGTGGKFLGDLTTATIATAVWNFVVDGAYTAKEYYRCMASALFGKLTGASSTSITIRDIGDTKNRITATVDSFGNRTSVTLDPG